MTFTILCLKFVGPFADSYGDLFGDYSPDKDPKFIKTPRQGLQKLASSDAYASGCDDAKCKNYNASAVDVAISQADMVVICLGTGKN